MTFALWTILAVGVARNRFIAATTGSNVDASAVFAPPATVRASAAGMPTTVTWSPMSRKAVSTSARGASVSRAMSRLQA